MRVVNLRPSSVPDGAGGRRSLGHPAHDRVWQRLDDHGITVAMHSGDSGYGFLLEHWGVDSEFESFRYNALKSLLTYSPISDALASLLAEGVLSRYRNLRVATIETGSEWVWPLRQEARQDLPPAESRLRGGSSGGVPAPGGGSRPTTRTTYRLCAT